jgi:molecular chaperone IbpA
MPHLYRSTVGFDRLFEELGRQFETSAQSGYPPYDVVQENDDEYTVTLAVAGFTMDELNVTKEKDILRIEGVSDKSDIRTRFLHRGIAKRNFTREFTLADHVDVVDATLELGMLTVHLKREVPEAERPRQISISSSDVTTGTGALGNDAE